MDNYFELMICIDYEGKKGIILEKGPLSKIDRITIKYEDFKELRESKKFSKIIQIFKERYNKYLTYLSEKNNRKENGDITILGTVNKEKTRIMTLYGWHIKVVKYVTIKDADFEQYIKSRDYSEYSLIQYIKTITPDDIKEDWISWLIRKIYKDYKEYAKENKKLSPESIYKHIKTVERTMKQNLEEYETQLEQYEPHRKYKESQYNMNNDDHQGIYDESNNEPTYPTKTTSYEAIEQDEKQYYNSLNFPEQKEKKGKQKTKKFSGGK